MARAVKPASANRFVFLRNMHRRMERKYRSELVIRIRALVDKHLHPTGWVNDNTPPGPILAYIPDTEKARKLSGGAYLEEFMGFTSDGIVTDIHMAILEQPYSATDIKDLEAILRYLKAHPAFFPREHKVRL